MNVTGLTPYHIALKRPLLVLRGKKGLLASSHLNVETFDQSHEAVAIVAGATCFTDMMAAPVTKVSRAGERIGLHVGMTGEQVLDVIR
jgi:uncharacterized protein YunC (DUF1805 family)